ncbi:PREDICTED: CD59 glycoprotein [Pseudopodoces humilis]|uniref:CD59 glycoprotein n=1 Tax=Pseudopodoces humilis TaxID=181119 RepID=UPI0006B7A60A|nr:PREDICTED: CD59 glycoprotein [Pseudopodoces humilis]
MTRERGWHTRSWKRSWKPSRPAGAGSAQLPRPARPERALLPLSAPSAAAGRIPAPPRGRHRQERHHRQRQHRTPLPAHARICPRKARSMTKMNCILLTTCIVLIAFCGSGYTLRCYHCDNSPTVCRTNSTCLTTEDTCLQLKFGKLRTFSCWKASQCSVNEIADSFLLDNFEFFCCQHDLCNESVITGVNKAAFSIASVMAMLWMLL